MFFRQILHDDLGCASYLIADGGEAAVIDPKWEIEDYLQLAAENDFQITHILETHNHADHVSGRGRLEAATGATIHVSADAGVEYEHEPLANSAAAGFVAFWWKCDRNLCSARASQNVSTTSAPTRTRTASQSRKPPDSPRKRIDRM